MACIEPSHMFVRQDKNQHRVESFYQVAVRFIKSLIFSIVVPGTITVFLPYLLVRNDIPDLFDGYQYLGAIPIGLGGLIYGWSVFSFLTVGHGTPAPVAPPRTLVVEGPYRYLRNPMYLAVLLIVSGEAFLFKSFHLFVLATVFISVAMILVRFYEEPLLLATFGAAYQRYCNSVQRWLPGKHTQTNKVSRNYMS